MKKKVEKVIVVTFVLIFIIILSYSCYETVFKKNYTLDNIEPISSSTDQ